jgi:hypothetical protein
LFKSNERFFRSVVCRVCVSHQNSLMSFVRPAALFVFVFYFFCVAIGRAICHGTIHVAASSVHDMSCFVGRITEHPQSCAFVKCNMFIIRYVPCDLWARTVPFLCDSSSLILYLPCHRWRFFLPVAHNAITDVMRFLVICFWCSCFTVNSHVIISFFNCV